MSVHGTLLASYKVSDMMTPAERKARINDLNRQAIALQQESYRLQEECPHKVGPLDKRHASAVCEGCNKDFGWYCPDSPDHACHYEAYEGKVELIDGTVVDPPADHENKGLASYDACIYCGHPDERK